MKMPPLLLRLIADLLDEGSVFGMRSFQYELQCGFVRRIALKDPIGFLDQ